jgi:hypothetical protein
LLRVSKVFICRVSKQRATWRRPAIESGMLIDRGDRYTIAGPLPSLAIPTTLHDSLTARLDRLAPVKEVCSDRGLYRA